MPATYTAADSLLYTRDLLGNHLDWVHETLAEHYSLEQHAGEEYLPEPLSEVMACLYSIHREMTTESVDVGLHHYGTDGALYRPRTYSTGHPIYQEAMSGPKGNQIQVTRLEHPSGCDRFAPTQASGEDIPASEAEAQARRAGLRAVQEEEA